MNNKIYGKFPRKPGDIPDSEYYCILTSDSGIDSYDKPFYYLGQEIYLNKTELEDKN